MSKLLYITDQEEYADHSFIGPLFEKYLKNHYEIEIVYFSEFKTEIEIKNHRIVLPISFQDNILEELIANDFDLNTYKCVIVRNNGKMLKSVLKTAQRFDFKVGYRLSFPKRQAQMQVDQANNKSNFLEVLNNKFKTFSETNMINECDLFLPTSQQMQEEYFSDVKVKTFICPPAIDPNILHDNIQHLKGETRFFYAGTLDKLREFETVLKAFDKIDPSDWKLVISTKDPTYAHQLINGYDNLSNNVEIRNAKTKEELLQLIAQTDVGVSILPNIPLFNTSTPVKIMDYYSSGVPCIMTNTANNKEIFKDNEEAWFCEFNEASIQKRLEEIINLSKQEVADVGINGQKKLLEVRNYEKIASNLALTLDLL